MIAILECMSEATAFDTHQFVQNMTEAGFTPPQTEALVNAQRTVLNANLVVKADLNEAKSELKQDIAEVKAELKADIARLDTRITEVESSLDARITEVKTELKQEIMRVESSLKQEIYLLKADIFKWMTGIMLAQATLIVGLIKLF